MPKESMSSMLFLLLDDAGKQKLIFTQDAKRIYYTDDDGQSFDEIY